MNRLLLSLYVITLTLTTSAQQYRPAPAATIYQKLQQLKVMGTVMYVAAHPDDENTRLISYLVHHDHVRTVYLSLTRGDGGQNILGNEQGSALGLIRTHELLEARKIDGAEQLFTNVIDFGFTKSPEETFRFWNEKELTQKVVEAYQQYKPDVVICRFPTTGEGGHGQHTVSAIVAEEAYKWIEQKKREGKTADNLWLPSRLLFNAFRFGDRNTTSEDQFKIAINQYDPLLGEGYGEMAGRSRSIHKSQGAGTPQSVGISNEYFKLLGGKPMTASLYDNVDLTWNRVGRKDIGDKIQAVIDRFDFKNPSASLPALAVLKKDIASVKDSFWSAQKLAALNEIVLSCAGVMTEALVKVQEAAAGSELPVNLNIISRSTVPVRLYNVTFSTPSRQDSLSPVLLQTDSLYSFPFTITIKEDAAVTEPYWLQRAATTGAYQYDTVYAGLPETPRALTARLSFSVSGEAFDAVVPVSFKKLDPVKGDVVQQLRVVPDISVAPLQSLLIIDKGKEVPVAVRLKVNKDLNGALLKLHIDNILVYELPLPSLLKGQDTLVRVSLPTADFPVMSDSSYLSFRVQAGPKSYDREQHLIQYPHRPDLSYYTPAQIKVIPRDWKSAVQRIGYIEGAGDYVDDVLNICGLDVEYLQDAVITDPALLSKYDAIVIGVRAFNTEKHMAAWMPSLLQYVERGGTLLVQYNTNQNLVTRQLGPYPLTLSRSRVTEEDARVRFTNPGSPLMRFPNVLSENDFRNWVQERGIYFPDQWDERYQTLFSMHDTGEQPLEGSVLYTPYGKGQFIYTSLVFFRQLPAGNAGAIRLMMNLLSAGKQ